MRQLIHDFRNWVEIEALGRSGAEKGIDIRALEAHFDPPDTAMDDEGAPEPILRPWYMQVKREKSIGPANAKGIADEVTASDAVPFGVLLVAPANISKAARDGFKGKLAEKGVTEIHVWGKGELEDLLYRPDNDHLLFAYFGISLQVRRRGLRTEFQRRLTTKRQLVRALGDYREHVHKTFLLRDPSDAAYPQRDRTVDFETDPAWRVVSFDGYGEPDFLPVVYRRHHAWLSATKKSFDFIKDCNVVDRGGLHGALKTRDPKTEELCDRVWRYYHNAMPEENKAWLEIRGWIHFDDIVLVDEIGDAFHEPPHVLVPRTARHGFFRHVRAFVVTASSGYGGEEVIPADEIVRRSLFPKEIPDVPWKDRDTSVGSD